MNRIVRSWDKYMTRPKSNGPDVISVEGERVSLLQQQFKVEVKKMSHPDRKVSINQGAVRELALFGPVDRIEQLFQETYRTVKRLRLRTKSATPFEGTVRFQGGRPNNHDITRWLDDLDKKDERYVEDIEFLRSLHVTLRGRCHPEVITRVEVA